MKMMKTDKMQILNQPTLVFKPTLLDKFRIAFIKLMKKLNKEIEYVPYLKNISCQNCFGYIRATYRDPTRYYCRKCAAKEFGEKRKAFARWLHELETRLNKRLYTLEKFDEK